MPLPIPVHRNLTRKGDLGCVREGLCFGHTSERPRTEQGSRFGRVEGQSVFWVEYCTLRHSECRVGQ